MTLYLALLHHPVYNKKGEVVTTSITGFDLHDIARTSQTFGVVKYFVVNPMEMQRAFAQRILSAWAEEESYAQNWTRARALENVVLKNDLNEVILEIESLNQTTPRLVATSAKPKGNLKFKELRQKMADEKGRPWLLLFGTGWGMTDEVLKQCDYTLEPIMGCGVDGYNHLSVRSAVAIMLDRLCRGDDFEK